MPVDRSDELRQHRNPAFQDLLHACNRKASSTQPRLQLNRSTPPAQSRQINSAPTAVKSGASIDPSHSPQGPPHRVSPLALIQAAARDLPSLGEGWWTARSATAQTRPRTARPPEKSRISQRPMTARPVLGRHHRPASPESDSPQEIPINDSDRESVESKPSVLGFSHESERSVPIPNMESLYIHVIPLFEMGMVLDLDTVVKQTLCAIKTLLRSYGAAVYLTEEGGLRRNSVNGQLMKASGIVELVLKGDDEVVNFLKGQSNEAGKHAMEDNNGADLDPTSAVLASVVYDPERNKVGAIVAAGKNCKKDSFDGNDEGLIRLISMQLGMLIALCRQATEQCSENKIAARNARYTRNLNMCTSLKEIGELVRVFTKKETGAERCDFFHLVGADGHVVQAHALSSVHRVLTSGQVVVTDDLHMDPENRKMSENLQNARSLMCLPIRSGTTGKVLGAVQVLHSRPVAFSKQQAHRLERAMDQTSFALEREQLSLLATSLQSTMPRLFKSLGICATVLTAERIAADCLGAVRACIYVVNKLHGTVWIVNEESKMEQGLDKTVTKTCLVGECLRRNKLLSFKDARKEVKFVECIDAAKCERYPKAPLPLLLSPVEASNNRSDVIGVLVLAGIPGQAFTSLQLPLVKTLTQSVAMAFDNCMRHEIAELALQDGRTMLKIAADIHHKQDFADLARSIIDGAASCVKATTVRVYLRVGSDLEKLRAFSDLDGALHDDIVSNSGDALLNKSLRDGVLINVDSDAVLEEMGYKRLHRISALPGGGAKADFGPTMCCPLFSALDHGSVLGAVQVERPAAGAVFSRSEETKLKYLCQQASPSVKRLLEAAAQADAMTGMKAQVAQYRTLCSTLPYLSGQKNAESINAAVIDAALTVIPCSFAILLRLQETEDGQRFVVTTKAGEQVLSQMYDSARGFAGHVYSRNAAAISNHLQEEDFFDDEMDSIPSNGGPYRNAVGIPIHGHSSERSKPLAVLALYNRIPRATDASNDFSEEEATMLQILGNCASVFVTHTIENVEFMSSLGLLLQGDMDWESMEVACSNLTNCQYLAVLEATDDNHRMTCVYPHEAAGEEVDVQKGLLYEAKYHNLVVKVLDSTADRRVDPACDSFDFLLRGRDGTGAEPRIVPFSLAVREGSSANLKPAASGASSVPWSSALCVPVVLAAGEPVQAIVVLSSPKKYAFHSKDVDTVQVLMKLAWQRHMVDRADQQNRAETNARRMLMNSIIVLSSIRTSDRSIIAKDAVFRVRKLLSVRYCAVYVENVNVAKLPPVEYADTCLKWDSLEHHSIEKRSAGIPGKVFNQRSPLVIDHVSDLDAGVLPQHPMGKRRSVLAVPVIGHRESKVRAVVLVAWKKDDTVFNESDEMNLTDFASIFAEALKSAESNLDTERTVQVLRTASNASESAKDEGPSLSPRSLRPAGEAMTPRQRRASLVAMQQRLTSPLVSPLASPQETPSPQPLSPI